MFEEKSVNRAKYKVWHLFRATEMYKMETFLRGGLWCAELHSFVNFPGDVEGSQPYGVFVSCWHKSESDPTERAWEIFGDCENGFALRADPLFIEALAERFSNDALRARFGQVQYLGDGEQIADAAFQVASTHRHEDEMRFALTLTDTTSMDDCILKEQVRKNVPARYSNRAEAKQFRCVTLIGDGEDDAIVLPVSPVDLIEEVIIGPAVSKNDKVHFMKLLESAGIVSRLRG